MKNQNCFRCDYKTTCQKKITVGDVTLLAKDQQEVPMPCHCVVHDICRDCKWYLKRQCASWKILNGKAFMTGCLQKCPKKVAATSD